MVLFFFKNKKFKKMKKILSTLSFLLLVNIIFAQKELKEGSYTYKFSDVKSKKGGKEAAATKMMNGTEMTMYFTEGKQKMNMNMMNGMMKFQMFMNPKEKSMRTFMDMMGQKMEMTGMDSTYRSNLEKVKKDTQKAEKPKATGKTKEILGYKCEEYIVTQDVKGKLTTSTMYITKEFKINRDVWKAAGNNTMMPATPDGSDFDGFPMEIIVDSAEMSMTMSVSKIEEKVEKGTFDIPEGYQKMDINQMKGMKGGF